MNPMHWPREHQVAWVLTALLGAALGLFWGLGHMDEMAWGPMVEAMFGIDRTVMTWTLVEATLMPGIYAGTVFSALAFYVWKLTARPSSN